jgi:glyoxylase-like metal-dependent hydrolase (beta-lactamase superfamily II)
MEVAPGLWQLELPMSKTAVLPSVNAYLLRDDDGYVLVDSGSTVGECRAALAAALERLAVPWQAIHTVVLTHGHPDHYGQLRQLAERAGPAVWLHRHDLDYLRQRFGPAGEHDRALAAWLARYGFPAEEVAAVLDFLAEADDEADFTRADRVLEGGETLAVGPYRFDLLWTPGHTPGHVCLYEPRQRLLLSGDHILSGTAPNVSLQPFFPDDLMGRYLESLRTLAELPIELLLPGHGEPRADLAGLVDRLLAHQLQRRARLVELLDGAPRAAYELAIQVWGDPGRRGWAHFNGRLRRNAVGTLAAHLEQLAADGLAERHDNGTIRYARRAGGG